MAPRCASLKLSHKPAHAIRDRIPAVLRTVVRWLTSTRGLARAVAGSWLTFFKLLELGFQRLDMVILALSLMHQPLKCARSVYTSPPDAVPVPDWSIAAPSRPRS